jgi:FkbM family methyltransferase
LTRLLKPIYHAILKVVLRMVGLDFSWYVNFYRKWPHALPAVEVCLQKFRPLGTSRRFFAQYDIEKFAKPGDICLDIGANVGDVSSHLIKLGFKVRAYEPDPRCAEFLRRRFLKIEEDRFQLHEQAVSDHNGFTTIYFGTLTTESSSILETKPGTVATGGHEVEVQSINSVLDSSGYAALIMMDIEGAEYDVLNEMLKPANQGKFGLCVAETHANKIPNLGPQHQKVLELIDKYGLGDRVLLDWR